MLKRQIFGLVGFELLRKRVLLSVSTAETTGGKGKGQSDECHGSKCPWAARSPARRRGLSRVRPSPERDLALGRASGEQVILSVSARRPLGPGQARLSTPAFLCPCRSLPILVSNLRPERARMDTHTRFKDLLPSWGEGLETMRSGFPFPTRSDSKAGGSTL